MKRQSILSNNSNSQKSDKADDNIETPKASHIKGFDLCSLDDHDKHDEERLSISSESTAHSEKVRSEEITYNSIAKTDQQKGNASSSIDALPVSAEKPRRTIPVFVLSIMLEAQEVDLKIYENDEDTEATIDKFCTDNQITGDLVLYLKISIVKALCALELLNAKKLEDLYFKLLNINYKLLTYKSTSEPDNEIIPYLLKTKAATSQNS